MDATSLRKLLQRGGGANVWIKPTWNSLNTPAVYLINAASGNLSFSRLQTLIRPSAFEIQKRDSSENNTSCHLCLVHKRCWRCRGVSSGPLNGRLERRPFSRSLRRTVAELIWGLCLPGISLAVDAAVLNRLRKSYNRIWRSCWSVVTLGCPGRGRSDTLFVVWNLVWGVQQYFDGNWIVEQLLWLICLLSTYTKLGCDHYYSDVAFLKPNKNFTIANSVDIWLSFSQVDKFFQKAVLKNSYRPFTICTCKKYCF